MSATIAKSSKAAGLAALCRAIDAPTMAEAVGHLAEQARAEHWTHEEFLAACLEREVAARLSDGDEPDDNPLAPEHVDVRLLPEPDDNPLAPERVDWRLLHEYELLHGYEPMAPDPPPRCMSPQADLLG